MNTKWRFNLLVIFLLLFLVFGGCKRISSQLEMKQEIIDGVLHFVNPEMPLKGEVILDVEKTREIDPYSIDEFDLGWLDFKRAPDGEVMFFYPTGSEIHRFGPGGEYLGKLTREGQGPGEFLNFQFLNPFYVNDFIYVSGGRKLARFTRSGILIDERKIGQYPRIFADDCRFFCRLTEWRGNDWTEKIVLFEMEMDPTAGFRVTLFFQGENIGAVQKPGVGGYVNPWGIPDVLFDFDTFSRRMIVCLNSEYKISVKNLNGDTEYVIEKPYQAVPLSEADKREILFTQFREEPDKWMLDAFPGQLVAILNIKSLPGGYLAVYRVSGIEAYEIDIFDPQGQYVYSVKLIESIDLRDVQFFGFGFARIGTKDDGFMIYEEYRIKNLPEIFNN